MKNEKLALFALILASSFSNAEATRTLTCMFTEPFFTVKIDLQAKDITLTEPDWNSDPLKEITRTVATNIDVRSDLSDPFLPKYAVFSSEGEELLRLTLNMLGSDGMSDIIFPFEILYGEQVGGCSSDQIDAHNPSQN